MAAEPIVGAHGQLEVDRSALAGLSKRTQPERLVHHVRGETVAIDGGGGQADPVNRDGVPLPQFGGKPAAHAQAHTIGGTFNASDLSEVSYQSSEQSPLLDPRGHEQVIADPVTAEGQ